MGVVSHEATRALVHQPTTRVYKGVLSIYLLCWYNLDISAETMKNTNARNSSQTGGMLRSRNLQHRLDTRLPEALFLEPSMIRVLPVKKPRIEDHAASVAVGIMMFVCRVPPLIKPGMA